MKEKIAINYLKKRKCRKENLQHPFSFYFLYRYFHWKLSNYQVLYKKKKFQIFYFFLLRGFVLFPPDWIKKKIIIIIMTITYIKFAYDCMRATLRPNFIKWNFNWLLIMIISFIVVDIIIIIITLENVKIFFLLLLLFNMTNENCLSLTITVKWMHIKINGGVMGGGNTI